MLGYETSNGVFVDNSLEIEEKIRKERKALFRIRNVSISVLVFVLLWILCITMSICFSLFQVGFSEKYATVTLNDGTVVSTGYEFVKNYGLSATKIKFIDSQQESAFYFSIYLWLGLMGAAFLFCIVGNILLTVLKKLDGSYDEDSFFGGATSWLFKITGFLMFGAVFSWIFGWFDFDEGGAKWLIVAILIFIVVFLAIVAISLVIFTIFGIILSSLNIRDANKEIRKMNIG